jgi:hypothetical protein
VAGRLLRWAAALTVGAGMLTGSGPAAAEPRQVFMTAPYAEGFAGATCSVNLGLTGACDDTVATADAATGDFHVGLAAKSLNESQYPSLIQAHAVASFTEFDARTSLSPAILYVATLSLSELIADTTGTPVPVVSTTAIRASVSLTHATCAACKGETSRSLTASSGPGTVLLPAVLFNPSGADVPAGDVKISVGVEVDVLYLGAGTMKTSVSGTLSQIEAAAPSISRTITAPFAAAKAERACTGSLGTTFECRSAAARTTGRVEMDLEVISPVAGTAPGSGQASGEASVGVDDVAGEVRAVVYILDLHVTSADAYTPASRTPLIGSAASALSAVTSLAARDCTGCATSSAAAALVDDVERPFRLDDAIPFVVWMTTDGIPQAPAGSIDLRITGGAALSNTAGQALVRLDAAVASVRAIEIA